MQSQPAMTVSELLQTLIQACGGHFNDSYFQFLDMEISECLYHIYILIDLQNKQSPKPESKLAKWGMEGVEFLQEE